MFYNMLQQVNPERYRDRLDDIEWNPDIVAEFAGSKSLSERPTGAVKALFIEQTQQVELLADYDVPPAARMGQERAEEELLKRGIVTVTRPVIVAGETVDVDVGFLAVNREADE